MSRVCGGLCDKLVPRSFDMDDIVFNLPDRLYPAQFMNVSAAIANPLSWGVFGRPLVPNPHHNCWELASFLQTRVPNLRSNGTCTAKDCGGRLTSSPFLDSLVM